MITTEEQALKKWCPFTRVTFLGSAVANRASTASIATAAKEAERTGDDRDLKYFLQQQADTHCIGSRCMAWQWVGYRPVPSATTADQDEAHGRCGLTAEPVVETVRSWPAPTPHHPV